MSSSPGTALQLEGFFPHAIDLSNFKQKKYLVKERKPLAIVHKN
jgi:hypothetical protein